jgi:ABC-type arginine/histidine transport system permease subunit
MPLVYNPKMYTRLRLGQIFTAETLLFVSVSITVVHSVILFFNTTYRGRAPRMPSRVFIIMVKQKIMKKYQGDS